MIIETVQTQRKIQRKVYYKQANQNQARKYLSQIQNKPNFLQKPVLQIKNQKRFDNNNALQHSQNLINKQDMSRSKIAELNQQLEDRTRYFKNYGKFGNKWADEHFDKHSSTISSHKGSQSPRAKLNFDYKTSSNISSSNCYKPITPSNNSAYNYYQSRMQQNTKAPKVTFTDSQAPRTYPINSYQINYRQASRQPEKEDEFHDLDNSNNQIRFHTNQLKNAIKNEVKSNLRSNVKNVVGPQNYYLMSDIKDSAGQIKDNIVSGMKEAAYDVVQPAIVVKDIIAEGAHQVKQVVKQGAKDTTKAVVGPQNFQLMKYIGDAISQIKGNLFGASKQAAKQPGQKKYLGRNQADQQAKLRSDSLNEVSPIKYSQRSFNKDSGDQLTFFWIYGLIAIGFFLVIFQAIK